MTLIVNATLITETESSFEVSERQLDVMFAAGVDVTSQPQVASFYRDNVGKSIDGVYFDDLFRIAEAQNTTYTPEIVEWSVEGDVPERFWDEVRQRDGGAQ